MSTHTSTHAGRRAGIALAIVVAISTIVPRALAAPAAPEITAPAQGWVVSGLSTVAVRGTADPGAGIQVSEGLGAIGSATADADGSWSVAATLADGAHTIHATASDGSGTSAPSELVSFDVDAARPAADIASPEADHIFAPGEAVAIEGTATDSRALHAIKIEYWTLGAKASEALADCDGCDGGASATWIHEPALDPGNWLAKVWAVDEASNFSIVRTVSFTTTTSGVGFEQPELELLPDGILPPEITDPGDGDLEPGASEPVQFGGTADPESTVELYEEFAGLGKIGGGADAGDDGSWSISVRLPTGTYGVRAQATDEDGNVSELSDVVVFTVDGERPVLDVLTADSQIFLPTEQVVLEGTVSDNFDVASVILEYYDLDGALVLRDFAECIGCPTAEASWRHEPALPFGPERYTVKVWAFDVAGNGAHKQTLTIIKTL